jgi:hypothetical protein
MLYILLFLKKKKSDNTKTEDVSSIFVQISVIKKLGSRLFLLKNMFFNLILTKTSIKYFRNHDK